MKVALTLTTTLKSIINKKKNNNNNNNNKINNETPQPPLTPPPPHSASSNTAASMYRSNSIQVDGINRSFDSWLSGGPGQIAAKTPVINSTQPSLSPFSPGGVLPA